MTLADLSTYLVYAAMAAYTVGMIAFALDVSALAAGRTGRRREAGIGMATTWLGFALHTAGLVTRGIAAGRVPWANMYEFTLMALWFLVAIFLVINTRKDIRYAGVLVGVITVLGLGLAVSVLFVQADGVQPALQSYWLIIHVSVATLSVGLLTAGAVFAVLQLLAHKAEATAPAAVRRGSVRASVPARAQANAAAAAQEARGSVAVLERADTADTADAVPSAGGSGDAPAKAGSRTRLQRLMSVLPSAETFELWTYRVNAIGFVTWTFTVVAGAIWAEHAWGRPWGWDPKETWSFVVWVVLAAYLHARATVDWTAEKFAYLALVAAAALLFNFYGVNIFIDGKHSYSGL